MDKKVQMVGVVWWPHSGGRWFCRSILKKHSSVLETVFTHPWLFFSTDMTLELDITAQVHKARSLPELKEHLHALKSSTDTGRREGLKSYFKHIQNNYPPASEAPSHIIGEMCLGSPIPRAIDLESLFEAHPDFKLIHLVRDPRNNFLSFAKRHELDSDPVKVAGSWLTLNAGIRKFFEDHPEFKDQYLMVRYEDLNSNPSEVAAKVCDFMGLPYEEEMVSSLEERWGRNTKDDLDADIYKTITELIYPELERFGYQ